MGRFLGQVLVVARKDLVLELRSRERLVVSGTFAVLVAVVFSFSLDPTLRARSFAGAMIWVTVIFAGILGLGRSFGVEREQEALSGMLLAPVDRGALFLGKFLANLAILLVVEAVIFPVYALFFGLSFAGSLAGVALIVFLASVGFMLLGTLFSAVSAHTRLGETLLPVLLLPLLIPVVIFAVSGTQRLLVGRPLEEVAGNLRMLLAFDLIYLFVCTVIFGSVVEE
ncbi:MAG TPA: heme exporter protein CcmB [Longimicrobiaceae bacterium]|nr:heme exporter protein CcmB [Longimicrobiaceae bacterium]